METFYLILVVILFVLAISDLIVGVSNDAVNFLNSAVGAKAASFRTIMVVATLGILVGATFSSGMMEVARKGIFHPQYFYFSELMIIFLAVMITDVVLLDLFNTYGMPTSTTVSIVFELLGAAVAVSVLKILHNPDALALGEYINSAKALAIISGILLSVVVAFTTGAIIQYLSRLVFSFDYQKKLKYIGAVWGGIAITAITYFILIKGAKGTSFMTDAAKDYIDHNAFRLLMLTFVVSTIVLQFVLLVSRFNIMRFVVLIGTFALAMAFAGNDLVNFIGVPLAGYESFKQFVANPGADPHGLLMGGLAGKVKTPTVLLLLAGLVMALTLWFSSKARSVIKTSLDLGRQEEGYERFAPNLFSRSIVRNFSNAAGAIGKILPASVIEKMEAQFDQKAFVEYQQKFEDDAPSFDMVRASVTLIVAAILIAIGTSLKLPLSTTYVTFMVAMGASLADGAWGRESAVYRVSGVVSVIGGWFFTALSAFTVAFILAGIIHYGGMVAITLLLFMALALVIRTHRSHSANLEEMSLQTQEFDGKFDRSKGMEESIKNVQRILTRVEDVLDRALKGLRKEDLAALNEADKDFNKLNKKIFRIKNNYNKLFTGIDESELEYGYYYVIVVDYLLEITHCCGNIVNPILTHVDNNHKPLLPEQLADLKMVHDELKKQLDSVREIFAEFDQEKANRFMDSMQPYFKILKSVRKEQIKRIQAQKVGVKNSNLFFNILGEYRDMSLYCNNLVKAWSNQMNPTKEDEIAGSVSAMKIPDANLNKPGETPG